MARKLIVEIVGDASSLERAFKKSSKSANRFENGMSKTATKTKRSFGGLSRGVVGLAGAFVGTAGLVGAARAAFGEMAEAQKVTAQTNAALKSTSKVAKVSAKHVEDLAGAMMLKTGIDDEAIQSGENLLLTFTNIRNEAGKGNKIFDQATKAALDLSVRFEKDLSSSAIMVGKALNDPIKGVTALGRAGVQFTKQQKDQIETLVESGRTLQAQKLILRELEIQVGGSAEAAGKTLPAKLNILRETLLNLGGAIAAMLTPAITRLVDKLVAWTSKSQNQKKVLDTVKAAASAVESVVRLLAGAFNALNAITGSTKNTFKLLLGVFIAFKALKLVSYIASMTKAMRGFAGASAAANAAGAGGAAGGMGRFGKALGAVGAVAVGAPLVAGAIRSIPGWDKHVGGTVGGAAFGAAQRLGLQPRDVNVNVQVDGKTIARATARPTENEQARRRRQRAHQRKSRR